MPLGATRFGLQGLASGSLELISKTVITSNTENIPLTNIKEDTYKTHILFWNLKKGVDTTQLSARFTVGGSLVSSGYIYSGWYGIGGGSENTAGRSTALNDIMLDGYWSGTAANERMAGSAIFYDLGDTNKHSNIIRQSIQTGYLSANVVAGWGATTYPQANVVDGINIRGTTAAGVFRLYGVKDGL
jgi:hypothetical protein